MTAAVPRRGDATRLSQRLAGILAALVLTALSAVLVATPAQAATTYVPISGSGSSWSATAINQWIADVNQFGMKKLSYSALGSSQGRVQFRQGTVDWAASEIPYQVKDGNTDDPAPTSRTYAYMPDTAGGTVFMYNLNINGRRVTNLRLSGADIAGIFTGTITRWNDPKIAQDNPGLTLPAIQIVPVYRSDGSGATAQFTQWMIATQGQTWPTYCGKVYPASTACTQTSTFPKLPGSAMVGQSGDQGVSGYVAQKQAVGTIGYVEYSYAKLTGFPVAKMLNAAGYYTEPTAGNVAVALLKAKIDTKDKTDPSKYLTQDLSQVYTDTDPRSYPLSSYSYMILPTSLTDGFNVSKGKTLGDFGNYLLCVGQSKVDALGYSALPINLVRAGQQQLARIPGASGTNFNIQNCHNPTFTTNGTNLLATSDPFPPACDKKGPLQCSTGTGGTTAGTPVKPGAQGGGGGGGSGTKNGGGSNTSGGHGASGANGSAKSAGAAAGARSRAGGPSAAAAASSAALAAACDPDSGSCDDAGGADAQAVAGPSTVDGQPVASSASLSDGMEVTLMAVAGASLLGLVLIPPLIALARRRDGGSG